jgi:hypothetical protein
MKPVTVFSRIVRKKKFWRKSMQSRFRLVGSGLSILLLGVLGVPDARADYLGFTPPAVFTPSTGAINSVNLGMLFNVTSTLTVDALGFYDVPNLVAAETVTLYNSSGTSLTSISVPLTAPLNDGYFTETITPLVLTPGQYTVSALTGNNPWESSSNPPTVGSGITFDNTVYDYSSSAVFPTNTFLAAVSYYGPTFQVESAQGTSTPEPGAWILVAAGLALLAFTRVIRASAPAR